MPIVNTGSYRQAFDYQQHFSNAVFPSVYYVKQDTNNKKYYLDYDCDTFPVPGKVYGKTLNQVNHFWRSYEKSRETTTILLTGAKGTGKTETAKLLANRGILNGYPVIMVTEIEATIELIQFLKNLSECILILDEFGKNFNLRLQDKMLSMLSDITGHRKLIIMTENEVHMIANFLLNQTSRVRYHIDFKKISEEVVSEYCLDHAVEYSFTMDIYELYKKSVIFSFSTLKSIVREKEEWPKMSLEDIIDILNTSYYRKSSYIKLYKVEDKEDPKRVINFIPMKISRKNLEYTGERYLLETTEPLTDVPDRDSWTARAGLRFSYKDIINISEEEVIVEINNRFLLYFQIIQE